MQSLNVKQESVSELRAEQMQISLFQDLSSSRKILSLPVHGILILIVSVFMLLGVSPVLLLGELRADSI